MMRRVNIETRKELMDAKYSKYISGIDKNYRDPVKKLLPQLLKKKGSEDFGKTVKKVIDKINIMLQTNKVNAKTRFQLTAIKLAIYEYLIESDLNVVSFGSIQ